AHNIVEGQPVGKEGPEAERVEVAEDVVFRPQRADGQPVERQEEDQRDDDDKRHVEDGARAHLVHHGSPLSLIMRNWTATTTSTRTTRTIVAAEALPGSPLMKALV